MSEEDTARSEVPVMYSQDAVVGVSFHDFSLVFFQDSYGGRRAMVNVALPPATAKHLAGLLAEGVANYEAAFGPIAEAPDDGDDDGYEDDDEAEEEAGS